MGFTSRVWNGLPPGVFIAMMGLLAALYPILSREPLSPLNKAIWTVVFFALMVLELVVIFRERRKQDAVFLSQVARLDAIRNAHDAHGLALERIKNIVKTDGVRTAALRLSESLLEFVQRRRGANRYHRPEQPLLRGGCSINHYSRAQNLLHIGGRQSRYTSKGLSGE